MKRYVCVVALLVIGSLIGFGAAVPTIALGDSPTVDLSRLVPFIRMGGGVPQLFDAQSTGKGVIAAFDLGVNPGQLGIVFGYGLQYQDNVSGQWTISDDGTISGGGCALTVLQQGWYPNFVILDGRYEIYDLPGIQQNDWQRKLVAERVAEQAAHYSCTRKTLADVLIWNEDGTTKSFTTSVTTAATAAPVATVAAQAATAAPTVEAATAPAATAAPAAERRLSGENQTIDFAQGESVYGWKIQLDNGYTCDLGECYLITAPAAGKVTSGVVNPSEDEISSIAKGNPWEGQSNRQPAG